MAKRARSPSPLPPSKCLHTRSSTHPHITPSRNFSFDSLFYDEIVLVIFSYLSWSDLCAIQPTNRKWSRLALDNQLWKNLYLNEYGRARLRGGRGFIARGDGREIKPLPGRAKTEDIRDWKWMFRISSNWRTGRCSVAQLDSAVHVPHVPTPIVPQHLPSRHLILAGNLTIAASSHRAPCPSLSLLSPAHPVHSLPCHPVRTSGATSITTLVMDQSPPSFSHHIRIAAFLSSGEFSIYTIHHPNPSSFTRTLTYVPSSSNARTSPIIQAVYHHPLLVTLSQAFHVSLYDLSNDTITHTQTLTSFTSHPPSSMVLSNPSPSSYKLILAYAIPVYPAHWSVGATELVISTTPSMSVSATRTARAFDIPQGWIDENKLRSVREQWGRKVARVAATQTDGKWVVLAPGESSAVQPMPLDDSSAPSPPSSPYASSSMHSPSSLQLYRLQFPASASSSNAPKLTFVRTLHGQTGPVSALALADGRCVSLGANGSMWVWDLEAGTGAEVSSGVSGVSGDPGGAWVEKAAVVFDERRIVSADARAVEIRRFDI